MIGGETVLFPDGISLGRCVFTADFFCESDGHKPPRKDEREVSPPLSRPQTLHQQTESDSNFS
jgi:hypothetical protein